MFRDLASPKPFVTFDDFGDSALIFNVHFYTEDSFLIPAIKSKLRYVILKQLRDNNIVIPFPQRDVHLIANA